MPQKSRSRIWVLLIIVILAGGGFLAYQQLMPKEEVEAPSSEDETANWKTYQNENYGFKVKHDKDWGVEEENIPGGEEYYENFRIWFESLPLEVTTGPKILQGPVIQIIVHFHDNLNNLELNEWYDNYFKKWKERVGFKVVSKDSIITSKGINALEIILERFVKYRTILIEDNNQIFRIAQAYPMEGQDYSKYANELFNDFINSFEFLR